MESTRKKSNKGGGGKISKYMKASVKALLKARDFYIKSMTECSEKVSFGAVMGCPTGQVNTTLPKSYSVNSSKSRDDDELRELIRAASSRGGMSLGSQVELDLLKRQQQVKQKSPNNMPRSYSVGIGRIDEDKTCEFDDDDDVKGFGKNDVFPRSRSYAPVSRRTGLS